MTFMIVIIVFYLLAAGYKSAEAELTIVDKRNPPKPTPKVPRDVNPGIGGSPDCMDEFFKKTVDDIKVNGVLVPPEVAAREARFAKYKKDLHDQQL